MVTTRSGRANNAIAANTNQSPLQVLAPTPKTKRKRNARAASTPAPEPAPPAPVVKEKEKEKEKADNDSDSDEDVGLFWQKNKLFGHRAPSPTLRPTLLSPTPSFPHNLSIEEQMWKQRAVTAEASLEAVKERLGQAERVIDLQHKELAANKRTGQVSTNSTQTDVDMSATTHEYEITVNETVTDETEAQAEFLVGSDDAIALLRRIEASAKEPRGAPPSDDGSEDESVVAFTPPPQEVATPAPRAASRPVATPQGFFSRSFSAIKSRLGFATPAAPTASAQAPATAPANRPAPGSFAEVLSAPPTPIGERKNSQRKKPRQNPMTQLLTTGIDPSDMRQALPWVRQAIADIYNRSDSSAIRSRLKKPVLIQDLEHFPSSKPWESGFGDPLGEMDDDEVVPVWAVYLAILAEEEEPKRKKVKSYNEATMDDEDTLSLDELVAASSTQSSPLVHNSHGTSVSHLDLHPRRSVEPSPLFSPSASHQQGNNIFREQQGQESVLNMQADREALRAATKQAVANHNPSQGSFGLDYDDDEDSSILTDNSEFDGSTSHLWTQPPPPAPVPAHAPLPGGAAPESPAPSQEQQVGEVERQRQKLMKHTPAKPSRLREAFVPSPSLLSEAGNTSIMMASPLAGPGLYEFEDMPDAEDLGLTEEDWADVDAVNNDPAYQASQAAVSWPDPPMTYDSDEETLSPE